MQILDVGWPAAVFGIREPFYSGFKYLDRDLEIDGN